MPKCPNCGQKTVRTEDWACQWCGYPLLSQSYKKISKTYKELKEEKLYGQKSPVSEEPEPMPEAKVEPVPEPEPEIMPELEPGPNGTTIELTVEKLCLAHRVDSVAADAKLTNKILKVTGVVGKIVVNDIHDIYYIMLTSAEKKEDWNVRCTFDKKHVSKLNRLTAGQTVTVQGKYDGYALNILMSDCVLVR